MTYRTRTHSLLAYFTASVHGTRRAAWKAIKPASSIINYQTVGMRRIIGTAY